MKANHFLLTFTFFSIISHFLIVESHKEEQVKPFRILALFSGTFHELGLDQRLGSQLLKLSAQKARQLYPQLSGLNQLELEVDGEQSECFNPSNLLIDRLARRFYRSREDEEQAEEDEQLELSAQSYKQQEPKNQASSGRKIGDEAGKDQVRNTTSGYDEQSGEQWISLRRPDAIIGPTCDELVDLVARMAAYWGTPVYSVASVSARFARKEVYPTLTRLSPSAENLANFVLEVLKRFRWRHLAILVDKSQAENEILLDNLLKVFLRFKYIYPIYYETFQVKASSLSVAGNNSNPIISAQRDANQESYNQDNHADKQQINGRYSSCLRETRSILERGARVARVFLLLIGDEQQMVRSLMLCAHELRMNNGEFTFLAPSLGLSGSSLSKSYTTTFDGAQFENNSQVMQVEHQNNLKVLKMFESLMPMSVELPIGDQYNLFVEQALELANSEYPKVKFERSSLGPLAVALHDSLLLACEAYLRSLRLPPGESGQSRSLMWNSSFQSSGLVASEIHLNENGDQELDYVLSDFEPETSMMRPVASYSKNSRQMRFIEGSFIHWPTRQVGRLQVTQQQQQQQPPPDEPECGFTGEAEQCVDRENLYAALTILAAIISLALLATGYSLRRYKQIKYQMSLDDLWWRINWDELQFIQFRPDSLVSTCNPQLARALRSSCSNSVVSLTSHVSKAHSISTRQVQEQPNYKSPQTATVTPLLPLGRLRRRSALPTIVADDEATIVGEHQVEKSVSPGNSLVLTKDHEATSQVNSNPELVAGKRTESRVTSVVMSSSLATYRNQLVIVKKLNTTSRESLEVSRELLVELRSMRENVHENLAKFVGLCTDFGKLSIVYAYYSRGSLQDMLLNPSISMDLTLKYSIIGDLVSGLAFIHSSQLDYHGRLKSSNLVLDGRFTLKITDFGLQTMYSQLTPAGAGVGQNNEDDEEADEATLDGNESNADARSVLTGANRAASLAKRPHDLLSLSVSQRAVNTSGRWADTSRGAGEFGSSGASRVSSCTRMKMKNRSAMRYFWTAPEHLRNKNVHCSGSRKGDVYSLAIILWELLTRREPYYYGTNARPNWPAIRADQPPAATTNVAQCATSKRASNAGSSSIQGRIRGRGMSKVGVAPTADALAETASVVSNQSKRSQHSAGSHRSGFNAEISVIAQETRSNVSGAVQGVSKGLSTIGEGSQGKKGETLSSSEQVMLLDAEELLDQVRMGILPEPVRPYLPKYVLQEVEPRLVELMRDCWAEAASSRPALAQVRTQLRRVTKGIASRNYLDNLLERLQGYASNLEQIVDAKSADIKEEQYKTEELLYQLLPRFVADRLKRDQPIIPQLFDGVTIFFSDIVGFEKYASVLSPSDLVDLLNSIYASFESIISSFDVTKIETIIDQFLVASGISLQSDRAEGDSFAGAQQQQTEPGGKQVASLPSAGAGAGVGVGVGTEQIAGEQVDKGRQLTWSRFKTSQRKLLTALGSSTTALKESASLDQQVTAGSGTVYPTLTGCATTCAAAAAATRELSELELNHYRRSSAEQIARMALCIRDLVKSLHFKQTSNPFNIRIGIHSGKVCAGLVGMNRPKFCLIGDTVNVASRMHTNSKANRIQISATTRQLLDSIPGFSIEPRGKIEVKGKGMMETFWLESAY